MSCSTEAWVLVKLCWSVTHILMICIEHNTTSQWPLWLQSLSICPPSHLQDKYSSFKGEHFSGYWCQTVAAGPRGQGDLKHLRKMHLDYLSAFSVQNVTMAPGTGGSLSDSADRSPLRKHTHRERGAGTGRRQDWFNSHTLTCSICNYRWRPISLTQCNQWELTRFPV